MVDLNSLSSVRNLSFMALCRATVYETTVILTIVRVKREDRMGKSVYRPRTGAS